MMRPPNESLEANCLAFIRSPSVGGSEVLFTPGRHGPRQSLGSIVKRRSIPMDHEESFVSVFVVPEKRARYSEFLRKPKRRRQILDRLCHFLDFVPHLAKQVPRDASLAALLRKQGAGPTAHVIGGKKDGTDQPLEEAISEAVVDPNGVVISCVPGRFALFMQEFPPGDTFILSDKL